MAITTKASGTQACTLDTEHTLDTEADVGVYVVMANLTNLVDADVVIIRLKTKVLTGDTAEELYAGYYAHGQGAGAIVASPPVTNMFSLVVTLEQTDGTGRSVPWSLLQLA